MKIHEALRIHLASLEGGHSDFEDTLGLVDRHFDYTPTCFHNGPLRNAAGENEGSCKVFALGQFGNLTEAQTLTLFGRHYRDVLQDPAGTAHGNIRQFMTTGWSGIRFDAPSLRPQTSPSQHQDNPA
jgi:hypothetical protein